MIDPLALHALADGEISMSEALRLTRDVEAEADVVAELRAIEFRKLLMKEKVEERSDQAWRRCRAADIDKARRVEGFVGRYAWALCSVFFLVIFTGASFVARARTTQCRRPICPGWRLTHPLRAPHRGATSEMDR